MKDSAERRLTADVLVIGGGPAGAWAAWSALYVSTYAEQTVEVNERELAEQGVLGSWRAIIGWGPGRTKIAAIDTTPFIDRILPPRAIRPQGVSEVLRGGS